MFKVSLNDGNQGATQILKWNNIILNIGGGYDDTTGLFTAPISGFYHFSYWCMSDNDTNAFVVQWKKNGLPYTNGKHPVEASNYENGHGGHKSLSGSNIIDLEAGDTVALWVTSATFYTQYNGFSGFYISS